MAGAWKLDPRSIYLEIWINCFLGFRILHSILLAKVGRTNHSEDQEWATCEVSPRPHTLVCVCVIVEFAHVGNRVGVNTMQNPQTCRLLNSLVSDFPAARNPQLNKWSPQCWDLRDLQKLFFCDSAAGCSRCTVLWSFCYCQQNHGMPLRIDCQAHNGLGKFMKSKRKRSTSK